MTMTFEEKLDKYIKENKLYRTEGTAGVKNLCKIVHALGTDDPQYFGQFEPNGSYGMLVNFLEDNPGAVEAILDWIKENGDDDPTEAWNESLSSYVNDDEDEE